MDSNHEIENQTDQPHEAKRVNLYARLKETRSAFQDQMNPFAQWVELDPEVFPPPHAANPEPEAGTDSGRNGKANRAPLELQWEPEVAAEPEVTTELPAPSGTPNSTGRWLKRVLALAATTLLVLLLSFALLLASAVP